MIKECVVFVSEMKIYTNQTSSRNVKARTSQAMPSRQKVKMNEGMERLDILR
jgi:hypothetical protein